MGKSRGPKPQHKPAYIWLRERLKDVRLAAGLTQAELGELFGKPHTFIHKVESGDRRIDPVEFAQWCGYCGLLPEDAMRDLAKNMGLAPKRRSR